MSLLRERFLILLIGLGGFALLVGWILWLARTDAAAPDNPFIYDL